MVVNVRRSHFVNIMGIDYNNDIVYYDDPDPNTGGSNLPASYEDFCTGTDYTWTAYLEFLLLQVAFLLLAPIYI